jgi:hypothetical protein
MQLAHDKTKSMDIVKSQNHPKTIKNRSSKHEQLFIWPPNKAVKLQDRGCFTKSCRTGTTIQKKRNTVGCVSPQYHQIKPTFCDQINEGLNSRNEKP